MHKTVLQAREHMMPTNASWQHSWIITDIINKYMLWVFMAYNLPVWKDYSLFGQSSITNTK